MSDKGSDYTQKMIAAGFSEPGIAEKYKNSENATRPYAKAIVEKSGLAKIESNVHILDLACGIGAVIQEIYDAVPKEKWDLLKVVGGDISPPMLKYLEARGEDQGWTGLETQVVDGNNLDLPESTYTHIFVSFGIFVMPNVMPKLYSLLAPGGFIAVTTWATLPWQPLLHRSVAQMSSPPHNPSAKDLEDMLYSGRNWSDKTYLAKQLEEVGFEGVSTLNKKVDSDCGNPKLFMETMQFPLKMVTLIWEEEKRQANLEELNEIMAKEVVKEAGGEDKSMILGFDGNAGWGWKKA